MNSQPSIENDDYENNRFSLHQTPNSPTIDSIDQTDHYLTNRSHRGPSFLPSIRLQSNKARRILLEDSELVDIKMNNSVMETNLNETNLNETNNESIPVQKRLNMSMIIPNGNKLKSPIPNIKGLNIK